MRLILPLGIAARLSLVCMTTCLTAACATMPSQQMRILSTQEPCEKTSEVGNTTDAHFVRVNDHGRLIYGPIHDDDRLVYGDDEIKNIEELLQKFKGKPTGKRKSILIFVHGGLDPEPEMIQRFG